MPQCSPTGPTSRRGARSPQIPRTLENVREVEETTVQKDDEEVVKDEETDEFAPYFAGEKVRGGSVPAVCVPAHPGADAAPPRRRRSPS